MHKCTLKLKCAPTVREWELKDHIPSVEEFIGS
jgi:hypothetical protein